MPIPLDWEAGNTESSALMVEVLRREGIYLWYYFSVLFELIFPYWLTGIIAGSLISVLGKTRILQWFGKLGEKKLGLIGIVPASILGITSPICMYGTVPIAASFSRTGMKDHWLAAFMMSSILLNPQLIIYSAALGKTALIIRIGLSFLCGIFAGMIVNFFYSDRETSFFDFTDFHELTTRDLDPNVFLRLIKNLLRNIKATGPYFVLGLGLTACFQRYVPEDLIVHLFGNNKAFGVLMAAALGVPLYACGGGTIPLLHDWLLRGMSMGSAGAFMISGPATKITNLGALKIILGAKRFALYFLFSLTFAFVSGFLIDQFYK